MEDKMMKAAVFEGNGVLKVKDVKIPEAKQNEVLLKILCASICGSDMHILEVPQAHPANIGVILGHEAVGEVFALGPGAVSVKVGDRVAIDPIVPCNKCSSCKNGHYNNCNNMSALGVERNGVFAQYCAVLEDKVHKIPDTMPIESAVFAEPLSCVLTAIRKLDFQLGQSAVILGGGPAGLFFSKLLKAQGASKVIISQSSGFRIEFAKKFGKANHIINSAKEDLVSKVLDLTEGEKPDIVIDTVGYLLPAAIELIKSNGKILLFGLDDNKTQTIKQYDLVRNGIQIYGSFVTHFSFPDSIKILSNNLIDVKPMVTHTYSLKDILEGVEVIRQKQAMKVIIYPN